MKISINLKILLLMIGLLAYFPPYYLEYRPYGAILDDIFLIIRFLISMFYSYKYFYIEKHFLDLFIFLFLVSQAISSIATETTTIGFIGSQFLLFGFYLFLKFNLLKNSESFLKSAFNLFIIYILFQVASQHFYIQGFDLQNAYGDARAYFLGRKNATTPYLIYLLTTYYLLNKQMTKIISIKELTFLTFTLLLTLFTSSSTALMCFITFILIRFFGSSERISNSYTKIVATIYLILSSAILSSESSLVSKIMGILFGKSSFSGRTEIWSLAIRYFKENLWFGYGLNISFIPWTNGAIVYSAHNTLLDILARYGVITGVIFLIILLSQVLFKTSLKYRTLLALLIPFLLYLLMENASTVMFILVITTTYYLNLKMGETDAKIS
ncbi:O-antigen ligase family protein [Streptococcus merionis]|uniref:Lipid A core - O-antigen ligase and related enzymes n=1 Tax=Streptococcus merionis TaxID=400065 RepID=A0A239SSQ4_9STRE|nr:O-antigen ligase family protein [Streptococcus merionis]SNU88272.1 Lipid A core - O-antigen ligase and related enzymes [Streptococcus merionis]